MAASPDWPLVAATASCLVTTSGASRAPRHTLNRQKLAARSGPQSVTPTPFGVRRLSISGNDTGSAIAHLRVVVRVVRPRQRPDDAAPRAGRRRLAQPPRVFGV